jgi:hypothetical protein
MSGWREHFMQRVASGRDPLDDPLNASWDAVVRPERATEPGTDSNDVAFLHRVHALETLTLPSPAFFDDLEQRLVSLYAPPVASAQPVFPLEAHQQAGIARPALKRPGLLLRPNRWLSVQGALAVLSVVLVAGLLVIYQSVPKTSEAPPIPAAVIAKPSIQSIARFEFSPLMWDMPDATTWDHMELGLFNVAPATSFTTDVPRYTSVDGPLSLTVLRGTLTVTPAGPALFYPANQFGHPPVEVRDGESVSLGQNETIIYSATDGASGRNPGTVSALTLYGTVGPVDNAVPATVPNDVSFVTFETAEPIAALPNAGATMTLQRLELAPVDTFVFEPEADLRYLPFFDPALTGELRMVEGAMDGLVPEPGAQTIRDSFELRHLMPGPHTIFNPGDKTVDIYFLVVEPLSDGGVPAA